MGTAPVRKAFMTTAAGENWRSPERSSSQSSPIPSPGKLRPGGGKEHSDRIRSHRIRSRTRHSPGFLDPTPASFIKDFQFFVSVASPLEVQKCKVPVQDSGEHRQRRGPSSLSPGHSPTQSRPPCLSPGTRPPGQRSREPGTSPGWSARASEGPGQVGWS